MSNDWFTLNFYACISIDIEIVKFNKIKMRVAKHVVVVNRYE